MAKSSNLKPFQPGKSGNPAGRPALTAEDKKLLRKTSSSAIERLAAIVEDDSAFGPQGWLPGKDQIFTLNTAIDRLVPKIAPTVNVEHSHGGSISLDMSKHLADMADRLPERIAQQQIIDITPVKEEE